MENTVRTRQRCIDGVQLLICNLRFFSTIFNEGAYLICKSIFHEALKDGIIAYSFRFCHATNHCYKTNCFVKRVVLAICHHCRQGSVSKTTYLSIGCLRNTFVY